MDVRQIPKASGELPSGAVNASLTKLMASANVGRPTDAAAYGGRDFIPATKFEGKKAGYVFSTGDRGLGYYIDRQLSRENREALQQQQRTLDEKERSAEGSSALLSSEALLKQAEEATQMRTELDARSLRKLTGAFERKYQENLAQRMKHPDDPEKFMDSEVDLDDAVQGLFQIVNVPELYPTLVETGVFSNLLHLLMHENKDIAADVVQLMAALTDTTDNEEWMKPFQDLVSHLADLDAVEVLVQHLEKRSENSDEEASVVFHVLTALDNMMDVLPEVTKRISQNKRFVKWLLMRLGHAEFDSVKQMCGELLVELLQHDSPGILKMKGLEVILHAIKHAVSQEAESEDELEYMDNLFDALCCCLLISEAKQTFLENSGIEMSLDVIKRRKSLRISCLRVLQFATTRSPAACWQLLEAFGLKTIFAFFMKKITITAKKDTEAEQKAEELVLTIISNLLEELNASAGYERVAAKFVENEFEKYASKSALRYHARVLAAEAELEDEAVEDAEERMEIKLDAGLATLQNICLIVCHLWSTGDRALRKRLLLLLHQQGHTLHNIASVVADLLEMTDDSNQQSHFRQLLSSLEAEKTNPPEEEDRQKVVLDRNPDSRGVPTKEELKERIAIKRKHKKQKTEDES